MNKLLMEENDRLQKQVSQLVYENSFFRQQTQNVIKPYYILSSSHTNQNGDSYSYVLQSFPHRRRLPRRTRAVSRWWRAVSGTWRRSIHQGMLALQGEWIVNCETEKKSLVFHISCWILCFIFVIVLMEYYYSRALRWLCLYSADFCPLQRRL